jgi:hypothetical protein
LHIVGRDDLTLTFFNALEITDFRSIEVVIKKFCDRMGGFISKLDEHKHEEVGYLQEQLLSGDQFALMLKAAWVASGNASGANISEFLNTFPGDPNTYLALSDSIAKFPDDQEFMYGAPFYFRHLLFFFARRYRPDYTPAAFSQVSRHGIRYHASHFSLCLIGLFHRWALHHTVGRACWMVQSNPLVAIFQGFSDWQISIWGL